MAETRSLASIRVLRWMLLLALAGGMGRAGEEIPVFGLKPGLTIRRETAPGMPPVRDSAAVWTDEGALRITVAGDASTGVRYMLPVVGRLRGNGVVRFSLEMANLAAMPERPAVWLEWGGKNGNRTPVFQPMGHQQQEVGEVKAAIPPDTDAALSFGIEVILHQGGEAHLTLRRLDLAMESNLLGAEALAATMEEPPALWARIASNPAGIPDVLIGEMRLSGVGMDHVEDAAAAEAAWVRIRVNIGGPSVGEPPYLPLPAYADRAFLASRLEEAGGRPILLELRLTTPPAWLDSGSFSDFGPNWELYTRTVLDQCLAQVRGSEAGNQVVGVVLAIGPRGEGEPWPDREQDPRALAAFRAWLKLRYPDAGALSAAWKTPTVTPDTAELLPPADWPSGDIYQLIHPVGSRQALDSYDFYLESWTSALLRLARQVKNRSHGRWLVGVTGGPGAWGSTFGRPDWPRTALVSFLRSPYVDLLDLRLAEPGLLSDPSLASPALLLTDEAMRQGKRLLWRWPLAAPGNTRESARPALRFLAFQALANGVLLEVDGVPSAGLQADIGELNRILRRASREAVGVPAEGAIVLDPAMFGHLALNSGGRLRQGLADAMLGAPHRGWPKAGIPLKVTLVDHLQPENHRLLAWLNCLGMDPPLVEKLDASRGGNRTVVWTWASGVVGRDRISPQGVSEGAGMSVRWRPGTTRFFQLPEGMLRGDLGIDSITGYFGWTTMGGDAGRLSSIRVGPVFEVDDPEAVVMARYADGGQPSMAMRRHPDWTAVYSASPYLNAELWRALARDAGAHVYLEQNDACVIGRRFITIHADGDGVRDLRLPSEEPLFEIFRQQQIDAGAYHRLALKGKQTYVFYRGTWDRWINP